MGLELGTHLSVFARHRSKVGAEAPWHDMVKLSRNEKCEVVADLWFSQQQPCATTSEQGLPDAFCTPTIGGDGTVYTGFQNGVLYAIRASVNDWSSSSLFATSAPGDSKKVTHSAVEHHDLVHCCRAPAAPHRTSTATGPSVPMRCPASTQGIASRLGCSSTGARL